MKLQTRKDIINEWFKKHECLNDLCCPTCKSILKKKIDNGLVCFSCFWEFIPIKNSNNEYQQREKIKI